MYSHSHRFEHVDASGTRHSIALSAAAGTPHEHEGELAEEFALSDGSRYPAGTRIKTSPDRDDIDHRHFVVLGNDEYETGGSYPVLPIASVETIRQRYGADLVEAPEPSIQQDVPPSLRYWDADDLEHQRVLRDALVRSGVLDRVDRVDGLLRLTAERDGALMLRRDAYPSEYERTSLLSKEEVAFDENRVLYALMGDVPLLDGRVLEATARIAAESKAEHAERLICDSTSNIVVDVSDVDTPMLATMKWRPRWSRRWYASTQLPSGGDIEYATEVAAVKLTEYGLVDPLGDNEASALVKWVGERRDTDARARALIPHIVRRVAGLDTAGATFAALGVTDPHMPQLLEKALSRDEMRLVYKHVLDGGQREAVYLVFQPVSDYHGDVLTADEIRKSAEGYLRYKRAIGMHHEGEALPDSAVVLSGHWVHDEPVTMYGYEWMVGAWMIKLHFYDDFLWEHADEFGVSPQGMARRVPIAQET